MTMPSLGAVMYVRKLCGTVFSCLQKAMTVDESRIVTGSEFHVVGPLDAKLLCP